MTRSHKFLLAATLLAGGYGVALLLGSLNNWIVPQSAVHAVAGEPGGKLVPMNAEEVPDAPALPLPQVPVRSMGFATVSAPQTVPAPNPVLSAPLSSPTWLAPAPNATPIVAADPAPAKPLAKVTNLSPWGPSTTAEASPWDRWPQWDPNAAMNNDAVRAPIGGAAQSTTVQASYRPPHSPSFDEAMPMDEADGAQLRTHIVVDGDSLNKLADRYLDDPNRASEIYELNRGVLNSAELLPIGVELRIPDRQAAKAKMADNSHRAVDASMQRPPNRFEPVGNWLDASNDVPRAQLLDPVPIGRNE